jgi:hypothetical protein
MYLGYARLLGFVDRSEPGDPVLAMQLAVKTIDLVEEIAPAMFEIIVTLEEGTTATLRMNAITMRFLMAEIVMHTDP